MSAVLTVSVAAIGSADCSCARNLHEHWRFASLHFLATRLRVARFVPWARQRPISSHQRMPNIFSLPTQFGGAEDDSRDLNDLQCNFKTVV